jgi:hypothetical protein
VLEKAKMIEFVFRGVAKRFIPAFGFEPKIVLAHLSVYDGQRICARGCRQMVIARMEVTAVRRFETHKALFTYYLYILDLNSCTVREIAKNRLLLFKFTE